MYYCLKEYTLNAILSINQDVYIINNLMSGILDCQRIIIDDATGKLIEKHFVRNNLKKIIAYFPDKKIKIHDVDHYPDVEKKTKLAALRTPAFEVLLQYYRNATAHNQYGFSDFDVFNIYNAIQKNENVQEYAEIMQQDASFAKNELTLLSQSLLEDNFRIFTVCQLWKKKINKCYTQEQINNVIAQMQNSVGGAISNV